MCQTCRPPEALLATVTPTADPYLLATIWKQAASGDDEGRPGDLEGPHDQRVLPPPAPVPVEPHVGDRVKRCEGPAQDAEVESGMPLATLGGGERGSQSDSPACEGVAGSDAPSLRRMRRRTASLPAWVGEDVGSLMRPTDNSFDRLGSYIPYKKKKRKTFPTLEVAASDTRWADDG